MGFEVAYDPGENIKIVRAVQKYPVIYNIKKCPSLDSKRLQDLAWAKIAAELGVSEYYVKNRWVNIKGCFKRYLKNKARGTSTKTYYLAEYLDFMLPFMGVPKASETIDCDMNDDEVDDENEYDLISSDGDDESFFISGNSSQSDDMVIPEESNADWDFFSSLLPDVERMNEEQKSKFRNAILIAIDTALYGE